MEQILVSESKETKPKKANNNPPGQSDLTRCVESMRKQSKLDKGKKPYLVPNVFPPTYILAKNQKEANKRFSNVQNGMNKKKIDQNLHRIGK